MKRTILALVLAVAAGSAQASVWNWTASLAPGNEVPPVNAPGASGSASGSFDTVSLLLTWTVNWSGLSGPAVGAHFHGPAPVGVNAGVQVNIGNISGLTAPSAGNAVLTAGQGNDLLAGLWYVNIHTSANPGGEIRGQVVASQVPLPGALPLVLVALGALGLVRRRVFA